MRPRAVVVLLAAASATFPQQEDDSKRARIEALIAQLADPSPATRDGAERALRKLGLKALPFLQKAKDEHDPEVRKRTKRLWESIPRPRKTPKWATPTPGTAHDAFTGLPKEVRDKRFGIELVLIPAGKFMMGVSPNDSQSDGNWERPPVQVTIRKPFYLGRFEVTREQWLSVMKSLPEPPRLQKEESLQRGPRQPVTWITWNDVQLFLKKSDSRLPTNAEWEYACRAGTLGPRYGSLEDISTVGIEEVGTKRPNAFGLHNMLGNVWEWCDGPGSLVRDKERSPSMSKDARYQTLRGGGGYDTMTYWMRASVRPRQVPTYRTRDLGFRVARDP